MIEIGGRLFRIEAIDHVDDQGRLLPGGGQGARITLRSGEWIYVDETYEEVKAAVLKAESDALAMSMCPHGTVGVCMYCVQPTLDAIEMAFRSRP